MVLVSGTGPFPQLRDGLIFHYTCADAAFRHILPCKRLRLSPLRTMRDPYEQKQWEFQWRDFSIFDAAEAAKLSERAQYVSENAQWYIRILSLTTDDPADFDHTRGRTDVEEPGYFQSLAKGAAHPRMWEHYADQHRGVCLAFDFEKLASHVHSALSGAVWRKSGRVVYGMPDHLYPPNAFSISVLHREPLAQSAMAALIAKLDEAARQLLFRKLPDWETEREYRFVGLYEHRNEIYVPYADALAAVIIGHDFPPWQMAGAYDAATEAGCEMLQIHWGGAVRFTSVLRTESEAEPTGPTTSP